MRELYPPIEPYLTGRLKVSSLHDLYYEECGNPRGKPVVFLHDGPGGGLDPLYRRYFDPKRWRVILFDQRVCGEKPSARALPPPRSGPFGKARRANRAGTRSSSAAAARGALQRLSLE